MNAKEIIELNNEKRKKLTKENLAYYEDMLVYIRLNFNKSEQQTEEVLLEILEHLLQAQATGRTAEEVFGDNPKEYCNELIGEIPKEKRSNQVQFVMYIVLQFLAIISLVQGIVGFGMYQLFELGSNTTSFSIGSGLVVVIIDLLLLYIFISLIFKWLTRSTFNSKKTWKWVEFLQVWIISSLAIGLFVLIPYIMPAFGTKVSIPTISLAGIGIVLYLLSYLVKQRN